MASIRIPITVDSAQIAQTKARLAEIDKAIEKINQSAASSKGITLFNKNELDAASSRLSDIKTRLIELENARKHTGMEGLERQLLLEEQAELYNKISSIVSNQGKLYSEQLGYARELNTLTSERESLMQRISAYENSATGSLERARVSLQQTDSEIATLEARLSSLSQGSDLNFFRTDAAAVDTLNQQEAIYTRLNELNTIRTTQLNEIVRLERESASEQAKSEAAARSATNASEQQADAARRTRDSEADGNKETEKKSSLLDRIKSKCDSINKSAKTNASVVSQVNSILRQTTSILSALGIRASLSTAVSEMKEGINSAAAYSEAVNTLSLAFENNASSVQNWASANSSAYNLSENQAINYSSTLGAILKTSGIDENLRETMATNLTQLAGDLSSFYDKEVNDMYNKIKSGIAGQARPLLEIGINLQTTNLDEWLSSLGIEKSLKDMNQMEKTMVRYAYLLQSTKEIQGDFARTSGSFSNQVRTLRTEWQSFLSLLGSYAIPLLQPVITTLRTILAYASAVIQAIAKILGLEQYKATAQSAADLSVIQADSYSDANDSIEDMNKNLKKQNELNKKNVKLLDLYELDFSSASSGIDTSVKEPEIGFNIDDLFAGLDDYKAVDFSDFINIDQGLVDEIARNIIDAFTKAYNFVTGLWSGFWSVVKPFVEPLWKAITWIVDTFFNGDWGSFAGKILGAFALFKAGSWLFKGLMNVVAWFSKITGGITKGVIALKNFSKQHKILTDAIAGVAGIAIASKGGYDIGSALVNGIKSGWDDNSKGGLLVGLLESAAGVALAAVKFGSVGVALGGIGWSIMAVIGKRAAENKIVEELVSNAVDVADSVISRGTSLSTVVSEIVNLDDLLPGLDQYLSNAEDTASKSSDSVNIMLDKMGELDKRLSSGLPEGDYLSELNDVCKEFKDSMIRINQEAASKNIESWTGLLSGVAKQAGISADKLNDIVTATEKAIELEKDRKVSRYTELKSKSSLDDSEKAELEELTTYFNNLRTASDNANSIIGDLAGSIDAIDWNNLDFSDFPEQWSSASKEIDEAQEKVDTFLENAQNTYRDALEAAANIADESLRQEVIAAAKVELTLAQQAASDAQKEIDDTRTKLESVVSTAYANKQNEIRYEYIINPEIKSTKKGGIIGGDPDALVLPENALKSFYENNRAQFAKYGINSWDEVNKGELQFKLSEYLNIYEYVRVTQGDEAVAGMENVYDRYGVLGTAFKELEKAMGGTALMQTDEYGNYYVSYPFSINASPSVEFIDTGLSIADATAASYGTDFRTTGKKLDTLLNEGAVEESESAESKQQYKKVFDTVIDGVDNPEDANTQGKKLVDDIGDGISDGLKPGNKLPTQVEAMKSLLNSIPTSFESAFTQALNNIGTKLTTFSGNLKSQVASLGISNSDITVTELVSKLSSRQIVIPKLATGAVLYPNNPFLAMVGDQRRGINVETPVGVITDAVSQGIYNALASGEFGGAQSIGVQVFIGDRALDDEILRVVTNNGISVG